MLALIAVSSAQAAQPRLAKMLPRGAARGSEIEVRLLGQRLGDAIDLHFDRPGIEVLQVTPLNSGEARARLRIAPDCSLGVRAAYLRTRTGLSNLKLFSVGQLKEIGEPEPNNELASAPRIEINTTVNGVITSEDVDHFSFEAAEGQRLNFELEGLRLGDTAFDPMIVLFDPAGREVAAADDTVLLGPDCALGFTIPETGVYTIQVREATFGGNDNCHYRLHVGTFPRPLGVFPPGGRPGEAIRLRWLGETMLGDALTTLPLELTGEGLFPEVAGLSPPSAVPFRLAELDNYFDVEPNDALDRATTVSLPSAINGVLSMDGDVDWFSFEANKGQRFDLQLYGRRLRSPIDSTLSVHKSDGGRLAADDDTIGPDSRLVFGVPEDGRYYLRIADHLSRGGPGHFYRLEAAPPERALTVHAKLNSPSAAIPIGNRLAASLPIGRRGVGGPLTLSGENLPPGVTAQWVEVPEGVDEVPVLFTADGATTLSGRLAAMTLRPKDPAEKITGHYGQTLALVKIQNDVPILTRRQEVLPMAVTHAVPFGIEAVEPKVPLVRDGRMHLLVRLRREDGYAEPVNLRLLWKPPGIGAGTAKLAAGQTTATLEISAGAKAPLRRWTLAVMASGPIDDGGRAAVEVSSQLFTLEVAEPWVAVSLGKARAEQGGQVELTGVFSVKHEFEGPATIELIGLPNKVTAPALQLTKDGGEVKYRLQIPKDAPTGKFNPFARATIYDRGEPIVHNLGRAELRIDKPLVPRKPTPTPNPVARKPDAPPTPTPTPAPGPKRGTRKRARGIAPFTRNP